MGVGQSTALRGKPPFSVSLDAHNAALKHKYPGNHRPSKPRTVTYDADMLQRLALVDGNRQEVLATFRGLLDAIVVAHDGDISVLFQQPRIAGAEDEDEEDCHRWRRESQASFASQAKLNALTEEEVRALFAPFAEMHLENLGIDDDAVTETHVPIPRAAVAAAAAARAFTERQRSSENSPLLQGSKSRMDSIPALRLLSHHSLLVSLDLSFNLLTGKSVSALVDALRGRERSCASPYLRRLSLAGNAIGCDGCAALADWLPVCTNEGDSACPLEVLSLFHCSLDDEAAVLLLSGLAVHSTNLRVLDLSYNYLSTEGSLTYLRDGVLSINNTLAAVFVESVRYDMDTFQPSPIDGEKRIAQACTPARGGFRPVTENPYNAHMTGFPTNDEEDEDREGEDEGKSASYLVSDDGAEKKKAMEVTEAEESERAQLRRRFLHANLAGIAPVSHALLAEIESILEPRRQAYVAERDEAKAATLRDSISSALEERALKRNYGVRVASYAPPNNARSSCEFEDAFRDGVSDALEGEEREDGDGGRSKDATAEGAEDEEGEEDSGDGDGESSWGEEAGGTGKPAYRVDKNSHRVIPGNPSATQVFAQRMASKYGHMGSREHLASVMSDAYAFRNSRNPLKLPGSRGTSPRAAAATVVAVAALGADADAQRLILQGELTPFRYKNGLDVIVELPMSTAKRLHVLNAGACRRMAAGCPAGVGRQEGGGGGGGDATVDLPDERGSLFGDRASSAYSLQAPQGRLHKANSSRGGAVSSSRDRRLRVATHDIVSHQLKPCWCQPREATAVYGGTLHYHCRHESSGAGAGAAHAAPSEPSRAGHNAEARSGVRLPMLAPAASSSSMAKKRSSYVGCQGTGHRCSSAKNVGDSMRRSPSPGLSESARSTRHQQLSYDADFNVSATSAATTAATKTFAPPSPAATISGGRGGGRGLRYNAVSYFSAPYQPCALNIVDDCHYLDG